TTNKSETLSAKTEPPTREPTHSFTCRSACCSPCLLDHHCSDLSALPPSLVAVPSSSSIHARFRKLPPTLAVNRNLQDADRCRPVHMASTGGSENSPVKETPAALKETPGAPKSGQDDAPLDPTTPGPLKPVS
ncbi:unnamed protein product, partial [Urochloa humidicola]